MVCVKSTARRFRDVCHQASFVRYDCVANSIAMTVYILQGDWLIARKYELNSVYTRNIREDKFTLGELM